MVELKIPNHQAYIDLFREFVILSNVEKHSVAVTSFAIYLAQQISQKRNLEIDWEIVFATSLFHDLAKSSQVVLLEPEKYGFKPLDETQMKTWQVLRSVSDSLQALFDELQLNRKVHETDVTNLIIESKFPKLSAYIKQIGGTRNDIYLKSGLEIKIMHYADWRMHVNNLVPFAKRLDFIFAKYWAGLPQSAKEDRLTEEFALERELFSDLEITPDQLDLPEINSLKKKLFDGKYEDFAIGAVAELE